MAADGGRILEVAYDDVGVGDAATALRAGRLVVHPTDTVVSLSGDPWSERAVSAAHAIKGYESPRPFLCLVLSLEAVRSLSTSWSSAASALASAFWPGSLTLVVRPAKDAPGLVSSDRGIAVRVASDPVSRSLLSAWGEALFSTSANPRGEAATTDVLEAVRTLGAGPGCAEIGVAIVPDDAAGAGTEIVPAPSTIVDVVDDPPRVIRAGAIDLETLRSVVPGLRS